MKGLLDAALEYAARGLYVLPCKARGKQPLTEHGFKDATLDQTTIQGWWSRWPDANVGIACGPSGLDVLDVDSRHGGYESLRDLCQELESGIPETWTAETGGGGLHLYFRRNGQTLGDTTGKLGDGLDTKAGGGYVVAPPSVHPNGKPYTWAVNCGPDECTLLDVPPQWMALLAKPALPQPLGGAAAEPVGDGTHWLREALGTARGGNRNDIGLWLANQLRDDGLTPEQAEPVMQAYAAKVAQPEDRPPYTEAEALKTLHSSYTRASRPPAMAPLERRCCDAGNAARFARLAADSLRYCPELGWLAWDGRRWYPDKTGEPLRMARKVAASFFEDAQRAASNTDTDGAKLFGHWAQICLSRQRLDATVYLAQSEVSLQVRVEELDADPWLLNCHNGTLDLQTGELHSHRREDLITKLCPLVYDPNARCPTWERFQEEIAPGDTELQAFKQRAYGYALTGDTREQCFLILCGIGSNGKSTELNAIKDVLGADYALHTPTETLLAKDRTGGISNDVARLHGARMVTALESDAGRRLAEGLVKQLTGGDPLTARYLYHENFTFVPEFKLFLAVNHKPQIYGTDHAIWRRIRLMPYSVTIPDDKQDKMLAGKLRAEGPGILAWMVRGCLDWQQQGLGMAQAVTKATEQYRAEQDEVGDFLADRCILDGQATVSKADLYQAYATWSAPRGENSVGKRTFGDKLRERGVGETKGTGGMRLWVGVSLRTDSTSSGASGTSGVISTNLQAAPPHEGKPGNSATSATCATPDDTKEVPISDDYTGPAIWRNARSDDTVTVTGLAGVYDGRNYYTVAESATAIPGDELFTS